MVAVETINHSKGVKFVKLKALIVRIINRYARKDKFTKNFGKIIPLVSYPGVLFNSNFVFLIFALS